MSFHILNFNYKVDDRIEDIFRTIKERNAVLFLGAGASVTEDNKFLGQDIINLYQAKQSIDLNTNDLIEFVDILSANPKFSRNEFDNFIDDCLRRLRPNEGHRTIAKLNWKAIITTNYDILVERAFQEIEGTTFENLKLVTLKNKDEYYYWASDDQVIYYKINGCISDKKAYPLVFSTDDFHKAETNYKVVLKPLSNPSDKIKFISIGYSYKDIFARKLLQKIDNLDFRGRRLFYNVDPYVNEQSLPWYQKHNICVIKASMTEFFDQYVAWEEEKGKLIKVQQKNYYTNINDSPIYLVNKEIFRRVDNNLVQLNEHYKSKHITEKDFFKGEEPNYYVIERNYDVEKRNKLKQVRDEVMQIIESNGTRVVPLIFLTGTFGTGKSTFAYRLINNMTSNADNSILAFEILDPAELKSIDLKDLFAKTGAAVIFLYLNSIEINSVFKSLLDLRAGLSIDNSPEYKVIVLASIRENVLQKLKADKNIPNAHVINVDSRLASEEINELLSKLKNCELINYRDAQEKDELRKRIVKEYEGDSFISLSELISGSKLINDLTEAYDQLGKTAQEAFLYTSMLYQFKIAMPSSLLKSVVNKEWEEFKSEVIDIDGKGILLQETTNPKHIDADLYFTTKHPLISQKLIVNILRDEDSKYSYAKRIVTLIGLGARNSRLIVNFLKALDTYNYFPKLKINSLFDLAEPNLSEDPHFLLHYAINLQKRKNINEIKYAIDKIIYAESFFKRRNHYLIHRRGVLNFELAKLYFEQNNFSPDYRVLNLLFEARDLLDIKRRLDPCSSFSFVDTINLEIWSLDNLKLNEVEELKTRIKIDELFDIATKTVYDNLNRIRELQNKYVSKYKFEANEEEYLKYVEDKFGTEDARPYGLILLFNFYFDLDNRYQFENIIEELEMYTHNNFVLKTLFTFYGRNLHIVKYRLKFFKLIKQNPEIEDTEELKYDYFNFIAECYNKNFKYAHSYLEGISRNFHFLSPDFNRAWLDADTGQPQVFEGFVKLNKRGKKVILIPYLGQYMYLNKASKSLEINKKCQVNLYFFLYGIRAELVNSFAEFSNEKEVVDQDDNFENYTSI
ncbi:hypothetical protein FRZ67_11510 [Panacibacter ginsenosidivorans]|uniref:Uncharacterized protein n=1 Tax=Panacibacter ginsenosidivorans TaxID=1813871 RepID=A0A5B8V9S2_9BACT|nr:SIR2 family protein [Panacibacter ginsenosidivorans]QEC67895.1 hypothetical protein FRZ67_11510 [Panacibacter ginsenosidivorans]